MKCFNIATMASNSFSLQLSNTIHNSNNGGNSGNSCNDMQRLNHHLFHMSQYAKGMGNCRRRYLLDYFGEALPTCHDIDSEEKRNCCDLCDDVIQRSNVNVVDKATKEDDNLNSNGNTISNISEADNLSVEVGYEICMLLNTIIDMGERFGSGAPLSVLVGRHDSALKRLNGYEELEFFGMGSFRSLDWWKALLIELVDYEDMVAAVLTRSGFSSFGYEKFVVTEKGRQFLSQGSKNASALNEFADNSRYRKDIHVYSIVPKSREFAKQASIQIQKAKSISRSLSAPKSLLHQPAAAVKETKSDQIGFPCKDSNSRCDHFESGKCLMHANCNDSNNEISDSKKRRSSSPEIQLSDFDSLRLLPAESLQLEVALRETRSKLAQEAHMKPYEVLTTEALADLMKSLPTTLDELISISKGSWGEWKLQNFGAVFCKTIHDFLAMCGKLPGIGIEVQNSSIKTPHLAAELAGAVMSSPIVQDVYDSQGFIKPSVCLYKPKYEGVLDHRGASLNGESHSDDFGVAEEVLKDLPRNANPPLPLIKISSWEDHQGFSKNIHGGITFVPGLKAMKKKLDFMTQLKGAYDIHYREISLLTFLYFQKDLFKERNLCDL